MSALSRGAAAAALPALLSLLAACGTAPRGPAPGVPAAPATVNPAPSGAAAQAGQANAVSSGASAPQGSGTAYADAPATAPTTAPDTAPDTTRNLPPIERPRARWLPVDWAALPGWAADRSAALWPALRAGCAKPAPGWAAVCARALAFTPPDDGFARQFLERELQAYRVQSLSGETQGLATGYFEPLLPASRTPTARFAVPLYRPPADLAQRRPYWTRQQLDREPAARAALRGQEIAYVASPLDALVLQIQGSGRLRVTEPDGRERTVRVAFAGHNDQPYKSVGRWLIDQGELKPEGANWPAIRAWGDQARPERLAEMLWSNPRMVFFREEAINDDSLGPRGAQGVPLTGGRSVAVDPQAVPYGTPLWLDTTEPLATQPLQRLVMAQDTGGAIVGAVRVDVFFGTGDVAEQLAGRMKQPLRVWALWPK